MFHFGEGMLQDSFWTDDLEENPDGLYKFGSF